MNGQAVINIAIIGTGTRVSHLYLPVLLSFENVKVKGLCGRCYSKTERIAIKHNLHAYQTADEVFEDPSIDCVIIAVAWTENSSIYKKLAQTTLPALIETPLGKNEEEVEETYRSLAERKIYLDIAEQYSQRPCEILKRRLIKRGLFGEVFYAFNHYMGHEYHGFSLIRSYLGNGIKLTNISANQNDVPVYPHKEHEGIFFPGERIQHAIMEFEGNKTATYQWSWLAYESSIRSFRMSGFHGTKGACLGNDISIFENQTDPASRLYIQKKTRVVAGLEVPFEYLAYIGDRPIECWKNPFCYYPFDEEKVVAALFISNLIRSIDHKTAPIYSIENAYQDHLIQKAFNQSLLARKECGQSL